ncbi:MAG: 2,3-diaminopropionate biosynthesis protein SbnA [Verrucomicrobiales bacterium]|nr:2,3-diaminopropionate biosynthesis protein SbnA [Verrucomicrobiales bacterium]
MTITTPYSFFEDQLFVDLEPVFGVPLFLKCEAFNFAGSVKLKAGISMVEGAEEAGVLKPGSAMVESSSGNLGVALSMIAAAKGYDFVCVTDSKCNATTRRIMEALGAQVHTITHALSDADGGMLGARISYVKTLCASDDRFVWLNQYSNPLNSEAHFRRTGPAIATTFPELDVLFVGAGTTGTLMGCARYMREWERPVHVVAVDVVGSVTFGKEAGKRMIPGLGTAVRPPQLDESIVDEVVWVEEPDTLRACHEMAKHGYLFGGSTGTVVHAAVKWLKENKVDGRTAVAIAPDLGDRYTESVYNREWIEKYFGKEILDAVSS